MHDLPLETETDNALAKCRLSLRASVSKKPMLCFHAVTDEEGRPLDESGLRILLFGAGYLSLAPRTNVTCP